MVTFVGVGQAFAGVPWARGEASIRVGLNGLASAARRAWADTEIRDLVPEDDFAAVIRTAPSDANGNTPDLAGVNRAQELVRSFYAERQARGATATGDPIAPVVAEILSLLDRLREAIEGGEDRQAVSLLDLLGADQVALEHALASLQTRAESIADHLDRFGSARARDRFARGLDELGALVAALDRALGALTVDDPEFLAIALAAALAFTPGSRRPDRSREPAWTEQKVYADPVSQRVAEPMPSSSSGLAIAGAPIVAAASTGPPDPSDLLETLEVLFSPELVALAASLGNDPVSIYEYVRNETKFEAYSGSMKGSQGALETGRGNDFDLASLLIALLRVSGHPARYVQGTTELPADRVADWLGLTDAGAANPILNTAGISAIPIVDGGGQIILYRIDRTWVEAYLPFGDYRGDGGESTWVALDPAFKTHEVQTGMPGMLASVPFDEAGYLSQRRTELAYEFYREQVRSHLQANVPGADLQDVPVRTRLIQERFGLLPASLPYVLVSEDRIFSDAIDLDRHRIDVTLRAGATLLASTLRLPEVALDRITITYQPAPEDQATVDSFGGLAQTPCSIVDVIPRLSAGDVPVVAGTQIPYCTTVFLDIGFFVPGQASAVETLTHDGLVAGEPLALGLEAHQSSDRMLARLAQDVLDAHAAELAGTGDDETLVGSFLAFAIARHHERVKRGESSLDSLTGHRTVRQVFEGIAKAAVQVNFTVGNMFAVTPGELIIDVLRQTVGQFGLDGDDSLQGPLFRLGGFNGSAQEHATWEEIVGVESVSTIKSLQRANETGNPVLTFVPGTAASTIRNALSQPQSVEDLVVVEVAAGSTVQIPTSPTPINDWNGTGILVTSSGGALSFLISGGLLGGSTTGSSGKSVDRLDDAEARQAFDEALRRGIGLARFAADQPEKIDGVRNRPLRAALHSLVRRYGTVEASNRIVPSEAGYGFLVRDASDPTIAPEDRDSFVVDPYAGGAITIIVFADGTVLIIATGGPGTGPGTTTTGDPVNVANGNLIVQDVDVEIATLGPDLLFARTYNSTLERVGALGRGWIHPFEMSLGVDAQGNIDLISNDGAIHSFVPDVVPGTFSSPPGVPLELVETAQGYELTMREGSRFLFGLDGLLDEVRDRNGNSTSLTYDLSLRLIAVSGSQGRSLGLTYDGADRIDTLTDHTGRTWTYGYDGSGNLDLVTLPQPSPGVVVTKVYGYEQAEPVLHKLNAVTDPRGNQSQFRYYANGRVFQEVDRSGASSTLVYDDFAKRTRVIDPRGAQTEFQYDALGRLIGRIDPNGSLTRFEYDADGNRSKKIDALGRETAFGYDALRNLTSITRGSATITMTYDPLVNRLATIVDGRGQTNTFDYDANGNRVRVIGSSGGETLFTFDAKGLQLTLLDDGLHLTTYTYGANGEVDTVTDHEGNVYAYTYDDLGRLQSARDSDGTFTLFEFDALNRLVGVTDTLGRQQTTTHDASGNILKSTDFEGRVTAHTYDPNNRVITTTDAAGGISRFSYGTTGLILASEDAGGIRTEYDYDRSGRLEAVRIGGGERRFVYDGVGNVIEEINPRGQSITYQYDALDFMVGRDAAGDLSTFTYDANGNILTASNAVTTVTYTYDASGRVQTMADSRTGRLLSYDYDTRGNRTLLQEGGRNITYNYNTLNLLQEIRDAGALVAGFVYDDAKRRSRTNFGNGTRTDFSYQADGRLAQIASFDAGGVPMVWNGYGYDADGARLFDASEDGVRDYGLDPLRRLASISEGGVTQRLAYDASWNLVDDGRTRYAYDDRSRLLRADGTTNRLFEYDEGGNLAREIAGGIETTFGYDALGFLSQATVGGQTTNYLYDALGRRVEKQTGAVVERVVWDNTQPFLILDGTNVEQARVIHGPGLDEHLKLDTPGADYYYHRDVIGSVRALSDVAGNLAHRFRYSAFGERLTPDPGPSANPYFYAGRRLDQETGLYFFRARYYDPAAGRFLQPDPFPGVPQVPGTFNRYIYAANNPAMFVDPTGEIIPLFFAAVALGSLIGGLIGGTSNVITSDSTSFSDSAADFGRGFLSGAIGGGVGTATAFIPGAGPILAGAAGSLAGSAVSRGLDGTFGDPGTASGLLADTLLGGALGPLGNKLTPSLIKPGTFKPGLFRPRDLSFYRSLLDGKNVNSAKTLLDTVIGNTGGQFLAESANQTGLRDLWRDLTGEAFDNIAEAFK